MLNLNGLFIISYDKEFIGKSFFFFNYSEGKCYVASRCYSISEIKYELTLYLCGTSLFPTKQQDATKYLGRAACEIAVMRMTVEPRRPAI